jgi:hypothetical protein
MPHIFQYGSNCSAKRLNRPDRLDGAAVVAGCAQTVDEYEIAFDVWSGVNQCAAADLIRAAGSGRRAWGVLYQTTDAGLARLREVEGPAYEEKAVCVRNLAGEIKEATTFLVKSGKRRRGLWTSAKYVSYIVAGLREHKAPEEYTQHVLDVAIRTNEVAEDQPAGRNVVQFIVELRTP